MKFLAKKEYYFRLLKKINRISFNGKKTYIDDSLKLNNTQLKRTDNKI